MRACSFLLHYFMYFMWTVKLFESPAAVFKLKPVVCGCRPAGHSRPEGIKARERQREREREFIYIYIYISYSIYIYTCASHLRDVCLCWPARQQGLIWRSGLRGPQRLWASARCPGRRRVHGLCGHATASEGCFLAGSICVMLMLAYVYIYAVL